MYICQNFTIKKGSDFLVKPTKGAQKSEIKIKIYIFNKILQ